MRSKLALSFVTAIVAIAAASSVLARKNATITVLQDQEFELTPGMAVYFKDGNLFVLLSEVTSSPSKAVTIEVGEGKRPRRTTTKVISTRSLQRAYYYDSPWLVKIKRVTYPAAADPADSDSDAFSGVVKFIIHRRLGGPSGPNQ